MTTGIKMGNAKGIYHVTISFTPASVNANTTVEQSITVPGVLPGDQVSISPPGITAGVALTGARVSAANTVAAQFANCTAGGLTPASGNHLITVTRPESGPAVTQVAD